jgi:hypothetical protein
MASSLHLHGDDRQCYREITPEYSTPQVSNPLQTPLAIMYNIKEHRKQGWPLQLRWCKYVEFFFLKTSIYFKLLIN